MRWAVAALAASALVFGIGSTAHSSADNFDALLRQPRPPDDRHELLIRRPEGSPARLFLRSRGGAARARSGSARNAVPAAARSQPRDAPLSGLRDGAPRGGPKPLANWIAAPGPAGMADGGRPSTEPLHRRAGGALLDRRQTSRSWPRSRRRVPITCWSCATFLRGRGRLPDAFLVLDQADALGAPRGESLSGARGTAARAGASRGGGGDRRAGPPAGHSGPQARRSCRRG